MKNKEENSLTKSILEFVPLITFFLAYYYFPNSNNLTGEDLSVEKIIFATKIFVPVLLMASALSYLIFPLKEFFNFLYCQIIYKYKS